MAFWDKADVVEEKKEETSSEATIASLQAEINRLQRMNAVLEGQNQSFSAIEDDIRYRFELLEGEYASIKPQFDAYKARYGEINASNVPADVPQLSAEDAENSLDCQISALSKRCLKLEAKLKAAIEAKPTDDGLQAQVSDLQQDIQERDLRISELQKRNSVSDTTISRLRKENAALNATIRTAKTLLDEIKSQISAGGLKNSSTDRVLQERESQISDLLAQNTGLQDQLLAANADNADLRGQLSELQSELQNFRGLLSQAKKALSQLTSENSGLNASLSQANIRISELDKELVASKEHYSSLLDTKANELSKALQALEAANQRVSELERFEALFNSMSSLVNSANG